MIDGRLAWRAGAAAGLIVLAWLAPARGAAEGMAPMPAWMAGAWAAPETGDAANREWADEYWTPPRAGIMIGAARVGRGERLLMFEHTRIVRRQDGSLVFVAQPRGDPPSEFPMAKAGPAMIEFASPTHDYPQRIRYWREGRWLKARISLMDGSKAVDFNYLPMGAPLPKPQVRNRLPSPRLDPN